MTSLVSGGLRLYCSSPCLVYGALPSSLVGKVSGLSPFPPPLPPAPPFPPIQAAGYCPNLAQGKTAAQSTTHSSHGFVASNAVDGQAGCTDVNGVSQSGFSHTADSGPGGELSPWWTVDLGSPVTVAQVFVKNRANCCSGESDLIKYHLMTKRTAMPLRPSPQP